VSKFFKALENAEREREAQEQAGASEPGAAPAVSQAEPATAPPPSPAAPRPSPFTRPPAPTAAPSQAYGAPVRRDGGATPHDRALAGLLEPAGAREAGEMDDHLVSLLAPTSLAAEQYRTVRLHIETLRRERGVRVVAIASPARGDGRTTSAINLAGALAQAHDARVALVEANVRQPGLARYLGLPAPRGLSTFLPDPTVSVDAVLERPSGMGFAVVVAGPASSMPYELLKSPRLGALFTELRERFDFVVVDTPPVFPSPDVGLVRPLVDGFVLIVRANRTPREMVRDSLTAIGPDRVLGVLFNDHEQTGVNGGIGWRSYLTLARGGLRAA
jgi:capsular exopolysaccharide synthesis family protein